MAKVITDATILVYIALINNVLSWENEHGFQIIMSNM